jgi:rare lipoprotein A
MKIAAVVAMLAIGLGTAGVSAEEEHSQRTEPTFSGHAHWYGKELHGHRTASGAVFDMNKLTAAHPDLKLGTKVRVVSTVTKKEVIVEINDRCPVRSARCIDLSAQAAKEIGIYPGGKNDVECYVLSATAPKK